VVRRFGKKLAYFSAPPLGAVARFVKTLGPSQQTKVNLDRGRGESDSQWGLLWGQLDLGWAVRKDRKNFSRAIDFPKSTK